MKKILVLPLILLLVSGCALGGATNTPQAKENEAARPVVVLTKMPTATNFPRIGTATSAPPTRTPAPTATPLPAQAVFDDETLATLMSGTINSAGVEAEVEITDERSAGGERIATITIISEYNIDESQLLLKLFVLEVGNTLRTLNAFSEGTIDADLDAALVIVNNQEGNEMGTVYAPMPEVRRFLNGEISVNEALALLTLTGVFESFVE